MSSGKFYEDLSLFLRVSSERLKYWNLDYLQRKLLAMLHMIHCKDKAWHQLQCLLRTEKGDHQPWVYQSPWHTSLHDTDIMNLKWALKTTAIQHPCPAKGPTRDKCTLCPRSTRLRMLALKQKRFKLPEEIVCSGQVWRIFSFHKTFFPVLLR